MPPNVRFDIDDATREWTYKPASLDFIHIRWLTGAIKDWTALYKEAYRCLKPGGWIEHLETEGHVDSEDGTIHDKAALSQWSAIWKEGGRKSGNPVEILEKDLQADGMREAGFTNIKVTDYKVCDLWTPPLLSRLTDRPFPNLFGLVFGGLVHTPGMFVTSGPRPGPRTRLEGANHSSEDLLPHRRSIDHAAHRTASPLPIHPTSRRKKPK